MATSTSTSSSDSSEEESDYLMMSVNFRLDGGIANKGVAAKTLCSKPPGGFNVMAHQCITVTLVLQTLLKQT